MAGTKDGGKKAAKTNKELYGKDFYKRVGALGGAKKVKKGFAVNRELASKAGKIGGLLSRRSGVKNGQGRKKVYYEAY